MAIAEGQFSDVEITISRSIKIRKQRKCFDWYYHPKKSSIGDGSKTVIKRRKVSQQ
jgi:hypothetical protein